MKNILLILLAFLPIFIFSQEKISFKDSNNNLIEFDISNNKFFIKYKPEEKNIIISKVEEFTAISENTALITTNVKELRAEINVKDSDILPVLIYKDGVKQVCNNEISIKLTDVIPLDRLITEFKFTAFTDEFVENQYLLKLEDADNFQIFNLVNELQNHPKVDYIEPHFIKFLTPSTNDTHFDSQWSIKNLGYLGGTNDADMDVDGAWAYVKGEGIKVAIIDEGVELTHPDLIANMLPGYDATGNGSAGACNLSDSHGTSCAGIVAAESGNSLGIAGIANKSKIIPIRIAYKSNGNWVTSDLKQEAGINWAVQSGADILSNSWGGGSPSVRVTNAINNAANFGRNGKGCVVLFATGNYNSSIFYPAYLSNVIAVGASSLCDERKSPSSCDGENWGSNFGSSLDIIAPGVEIYTTTNSGGYVSDFNGTSSACPNAAGVAALVLSADNTLTSSEVKTILETSVDKPAGYIYSNHTNGDWNEEVGYGRINALNAVLKAVKIIGNPIVCEQESYYVSNLPSNKKVSWSLANGSALELTTTSNNGCVISNPNFYPKVTTLTATITNRIDIIKPDPISRGVQEVLTYTIEIATESQNNTVQYGTYNQEACMAGNVHHDAISGSLNGSPVWLHQGCLTYVNLSGMFGRTVSLTGSGTPDVWQYNPATHLLYFRLPLGSGGVPFIFTIHGDGACHEKQLMFFTFSNNGKSNNGKFEVTTEPNPVSDVLTVNITENRDAQGYGDDFENQMFSVSLIDINTSQHIYTQKGYVTDGSTKINVENLKTGLYIIKVIIGNEVRTSKFLKI